MSDKKDFVYYPTKADYDSYEKLSKKKEFYLNKKKPFTEEQKNDITKLCQTKDKKKFKLMPQQKFLKNFMSPDSPYKNMLIIHGTGAGKCVTGDTQLYLKSKKSISIKNLWDQFKTNKVSIDEDGGEWSMCNKILYIKSYDVKARDIVYKKIKLLYRQKICEYIYDITLENNINIKITCAHKLFVTNSSFNDAIFTNKFIIGDTKICFIENNRIKFVGIKKFNIIHHDDYVYDLEIEDLHNYFGNNILCHNTCAAIQIAESYKSYLIRLDDRMDKEITKKTIRPTIYIIAGDAAINNFKNELLGKCVGDEYVSSNEKQKLKDLYKDPNEQSSELYKKKLKEYHKRLTSRNQNGFYKFLGYRDFQNRTIGEKIKNDAGRVVRDPETGKPKRKIKEPQITNVNNSLIIVDEAHNLVNSNQPNDWAKAIQHVYKKSKNVRLILLTATPMTHRPREIIDILNLIRLDKNEVPLKKSDFFRDEKLLSGADKKIAEESRGYISYLRGYNIYTYPEKIDMGILLKNKGFKYTKLVICPMSKLHYNTYKSVYHGKIGREEWSLINMVFPNPANPNIGIFKNSEIENLINAPRDFKKKYGIKFITLTSGHIHQITGSFLEKENLKLYSSKYYKLLDNLDNAILNDHGHSFVYSKVVVGTGTRLIKQILLQNGYAEYVFETGRGVKNETGSVGYDNIKCYYCGVLGKYHKDRAKGKAHVFYPARFIVIDRDTEKREQKNLIEDFVSEENKDAHIVKIIIGSPMTKEAIDLKRIMYIHITSFHDNFSLLEQIIGRGARHCSHVDLPSNKRFVKIFRYVSSLPDFKTKTLSYEEERYLDGEKHHITIKKIEHILKINAVDCTLNKPANVFSEEVRKYKDCETKKNPIKCSPLCDYTNCDYKCFYELPSKRVLTFSDLDTSTYDIYHYDEELSILKKYIRLLFKQYTIWTIDDIIYNIFHNQPKKFLTSNISKYKKNIIKDIQSKEQYIRSILPSAKSYSVELSRKTTKERLKILRESMEYIDIKYIYLALQDLTESRTLIYNPFGNQGYIINLGTYFIFQPSDNINDTIPIFERNLPQFDVNQTNISVNSYIRKYYEPKVKRTREMTIADVKNKIATMDVENFYKISQLIGNLPLQTQIILLENAIEISHHNPDDEQKSYTKKIFRFFKDFLIDNKKFKGTYDYRFSHSIVDDIYVDKTVQIIGHMLTPEPRCYINDKWITCIYELFGRTRKEATKKFKDNQFIIGYIDKTKHGKMVFKLRYTHPESILSKDRRRMFKGFICNQHSNKKELLDIAEKLDIKGFTKKTTIQHICTNIEEKLRHNEVNERNNPKSKIKWFYEYIELINRENRKLVKK